MPRKIRQLAEDLEKAGFELTPGKGSHRKYRHPISRVVVLLSGQLGADAKRYQEKQVQLALEATKRNP